MVGRGKLGWLFCAISNFNFGFVDAFMKNFCLLVEKGFGVMHGNGKLFLSIKNNNQSINKSIRNLKLPNVQVTLRHVSRPNNFLCLQLIFCPAIKSKFKRDVRALKALKAK